jgi:drug/metabolite transporter (DMT)-like permease
MMTHFFLLRHFDCSFDLKSSHNIRLVVKRNLLICVDNFALTAVLFVLPFPIVFTLNCSCVLFVFMLDYLMFNVKINRQQLWGVTFGFFGVLLTINGEFIIDLLYPEFEKQTEFKNYLTDDPYIKLAAGIAFILVNLSRAYALCITKQMRNVNGLQLSFYVGFILLFECGLLYPSYVSERTSISDMLWSVVFCAIPQNIVQILFLSALVLSKNTGITNLMGFLSIAVSYFVSLVRYNERLNKICLVGVGLICYGIVKTLRNREEHQK